MTRRLLPLLLLLSLACRGARRDEAVATPASGPWEEARRAGVDFRAVGQEPGWLLEIREGERIDMVTDNGERRISFDAPVREVGVKSARTIYRAELGPRRIYVDLDRQPCTDAMSGEAFDITVTVLLDGYRYSGCGRELR